jgi:hypothetical protein
MLFTSNILTDAVVLNAKRLAFSMDRQDIATWMDGIQTPQTVIFSIKIALTMKHREVLNEFAKNRRELLIGVQQESLNAAHCRMIDMALSETVRNIQGHHLLHTQHMQS